MCNRLTALALGGKVPNYLLRIKSTKRSMSKATEQKEPLYKVLTPPVKSLTDKKSYKVICLPNGLTACLVSDPAKVESSAENESSESDYESDELSLASTDETFSPDEAENEVVEDEDVDSKAVKSPHSEEKMAATGLCINVGSFSDIKEIPGLAHFLEHMVFMGSEKYPQENDFDSFIKKRGGFDNAATDCETTIFYFECLEKYLFKALDKFAQFFISPLMKRGSMTREREAVESEFQMALPSDSSRKEQLLFSLFNPEVPINQFMWGNLKTLRDDVSDDFLYEKLHEFRKRHYSAHRMTLAIQARLPMEELEDYVYKCFANVPSNNLPADQFDKYQNKIFENKNFTKICHIEQLKEALQVDLLWVLPSMLKKYRTKPHQYVSWLLGHEGKGSLISYLRKKVWVLSIYTGTDESGTEYNSMYTIFTVQMVLTQDGYKHLSEIITAMFSYIKLIRADERLFKEMQAIEDMSFLFADEEPPIDFVETLCENMQFYPPEDYLTGSDLFFEYSPQDIDSVISLLTPEKMRISVFNSDPPPDIVYDQVEPWFGTKYTFRDIPQEWMNEWSTVKIYPEFQLPAPNAFLTTNFDLLPELDSIPEYPTKLLNNELVELWYRKDQKFKLPLAYYYFHLMTPVLAETPLNNCLNDMFIALLHMQLIEETYPAEIALLSYKIMTSEKGVLINVYGYNEKLPILIDLIAKYIVNLGNTVDEAMFDAIKDKQIKYYHNKFFKPATLAKELRMSVLVNKFWTSVDKHETVKSITFEMMKEYCCNFGKKLYIQSLVQGNVDSATALNSVQSFIKTLNYEPLNPKNRRKFQIYEIPKGQFGCKIKSLNSKNSNSIITNYYQSGPYNMKDSVIIELIMMIIEEPLFDTLRTKEQLGYDVHCTSRDTFGVIGYSITVNAQATKNSVKHVDQRIEGFVRNISKTLRKMAEKKFNQTKADLIKVKQCADILLKDEVNRNWNEIVNEYYIFNREKEEVDTIETIKLTDVRKWWTDNTICGNKNNCRKLSIQVEGHGVKKRKDSDAEQDDSKQPSIESADDSDYESSATKTFKMELVDTGSQAIKYYISSVKTFQEGLNLFPEKSTK